MTAPRTLTDTREDSPTRLTFTEANHSYWLADPVTGRKRRVPSVSALKKTLHPFENERYQMGLAAAATVDNWVNLTREPPTSRQEKIVSLALERGAIPRQFGTAVHHYCEQLWTGEAVEVPGEYAGHVQAVADWWTGERVTLAEVERLCWSDGDEWGTGPAAGRFDLIVKHPDRGLGLLDLKTWMPGSAGLPRPEEWAFQLAAYAAMEYMVIGGEDVYMPAVEWCGVLHVGPPGAELWTLPRTDWDCAHERVLCARQLKNLPKPTMERSA